MKTDRELLELAARADGYKEAGINQAYTNGLLSSWNPLADDGDALRLAVSLGMLLDVVYMAGFGETAAIANGDISAAEKHNGDPYAATRRAIVRAAAAIGERMK